MDETNNIENNNDKRKHIKRTQIILLMGGLFMIYGGIIDVMGHFGINVLLAPPSWHNINSTIGLICGILILLAAFYLILMSFRLKSLTQEDGNYKIKVNLKNILIVCIIGTILDFIAGYYARGFLLVILKLLYLNYNLEKEKKGLYICISLVILTMIIMSFVFTGGI